MSEKDYTISNITMVLVICPLCFILAICAFIFIGVSKVYAADYLSIYQDPTLINSCNNCTSLDTMLNNNHSSQRITIYQNAQGTIVDGSYLEIDFNTKVSFIYNTALSNNIVNMNASDLYFYIGDSNNHLIDISGYCKANKYDVSISSQPGVPNNYVKTYDINYSCGFNIVGNYTFIQVSQGITNNFNINDNVDSRFIYTQISDNYLNINTNSPNSSNQDIINNNNSNTNIIINNQNQNKDEIIGAINGSGLENNKPTDNTDFDNYEDAESGLMNEDNLNAINDIDISIDSNSSDFIWTLVTRILNTHALVFGAVITCLSLGIIKLILNR